MNWKECVLLNEKYDILSIFEWPMGKDGLGFDCNPDFKFNDMWGLLSWVWTWPGDYLLNVPEVKAFFEMGPETVVGSAWSTALGSLLLDPMIAV